VEALGAGLRVARAVVDNLLHRRLADVRAVAADRLDVVALGAVEGDGDRARRPRGVDVHAGLAVVLPLQVDLALVDRGLAPGRVAADVVAVRLVVDVLEAGEEHRVEHGRGELADAAADRLGELAAADHARGDVALRGAARAG